MTNMGKGIDKIVEIVEDHAIMCGFLEELSCYIKSKENGGEPLRPFMPHLNDIKLMDTLSTVAEKVVK